MRCTAKGTGDASFPSFKIILCGRSSSLNCSGSCHLWTMPCSVCRGESIVVGLMGAVAHNWDVSEDCSPS